MQVVLWFHGLTPKGDLAGTLEKSPIRRVGLAEDRQGPSLVSGAIFGCNTVGPAVKTVNDSTYSIAQISKGITKGTVTDVPRSEADAISLLYGVIPTNHHSHPLDPGSPTRVTLPMGGLQPLLPPLDDPRPSPALTPVHVNLPNNSTTLGGKGPWKTAVGDSGASLLWLKCHQHHQRLRQNRHSRALRSSPPWTRRS